LQEFAATIDHLAHHVHVKLPEHLISKEAARTFADRIRERHRRRQLLLGAKTLSEALNQALELEAADIAAGVPPRIRQTTARTFWKGHSPPTEQRLPTDYVLALWEHPPLSKELPPQIE
jgi:hypothetical protein